MAPRQTLKVRLDQAAAPLRAALERLAESPRELRCFVIIREPLTRHFAQFCTPPPASRFVGGPQIVTALPLIFDGYGDGKPGGYVYVQAPCEADHGVQCALDALALRLPAEAELQIIEESTQRKRPS
jgi:hypothetical protein